jgi:hypothetical protein
MTFHEITRHRGQYSTEHRSGCRVTACCLVLIMTSATRIYGLFMDIKFEECLLTCNSQSKGFQRVGITSRGSGLLKVHPFGIRVIA